MGKILAFRQAAPRQAAVPRSTGWADWVRLAAAQLLGVIEIRPKWWDGNTLDALNERMLRDVGLTRDEFDAIRRADHHLVAPAPPDVLGRPGPAAMLDVAGRPLPDANGPFTRGRRW